jgi:uncharacterized membrane protein YtjA (UPF0391 family)
VGQLDAAPASASFSLYPLQEGEMLQLAISFLVIGIIASLLGFTTIAGVSYAIAKIVGVVFLVGFVVLLFIGLGIGRSLSS